MVVDEDIEMELADIVTAVEGNDKGSEESDDKWEDGEAVGTAEMDATEDMKSDNMASKDDEAPREEAKNETQQPEAKKHHY